MIKMRRKTNGDDFYCDGTEERRGQCSATSATMVSVVPQRLFRLRLLFFLTDLPQNTGGPKLPATCVTNVQAGRTGGSSSCPLCQVSVHLLEIIFSSRAFMIFILLAFERVFAIRQTCDRL